MSPAITFLNRSISREDGGISEAARRLGQELLRGGASRVDVLALQDRHSAADLPAWAPIEPRVFSPMLGNPYGYTPGFRQELDAASPDVCHVHGLWLYHTLVARRWAQAHDRAFVISPHGMLDPWALGNSRWKKRLVAVLTEDSNLRAAGCLHATCPPELEAIRAYGLRTPVAVISNAVDLPDLTSSPAAPPWSGQIPAGKKVLLYFGRIHAKKGLRPLIEGWSALQRKGLRAADEWVLVIAGWDQSGFEAELRTLAAELQVQETVHFAGPHFGAARDAVYRGADAFILPSFSEGLPLAVLEAWAAALPVVMTAACNLPQGFEASAAIRVELQAESIANGLATLTEMCAADRQSTGARGRRLVERHFTWSRAAEEMLQMYRWLLGGGAAPASVELAR